MVNTLHGRRLYRGDGGDASRPNLAWGTETHSVPPTFATFSKQKLDLFSILTTI